MVSPRSGLAILALAVPWVLAACTPAATPAPTPIPPSPTASPAPTEPPPPTPTLLPPSPTPTSEPDPVEDRFLELVAFVAAELGIPESQIRVISTEAVTFSNGCLDLNSPGEMCTAVLTPGFVVSLDTPQGEMVFHTNQSGTFFREAQPLQEGS